MSRNTPSAIPRVALGSVVGTALENVCPLTARYGLPLGTANLGTNPSGSLEISKQNGERQRCNERIAAVKNIFNAAVNKLYHPLDKVL